MSLHRLVQVVQQARMTPQEQRQWTQRLVFSVQAIFPQEPYELAARQRCERLLQQALACETLIEQHQLQQAEAADLLHRIGHYLAEHGFYLQARPLLRRALSMREQQLGPEHLETAKVLQNFASSQQAQGRTQEAVIMYQRALTMREHILGSDHPLTLEIRTRLQEVLATPGLTLETEPTET